MSRVAFEPQRFQNNAFQTSGLEGPVPTVTLCGMGLATTIHRMTTMLMYRAVVSTSGRRSERP
jgi:hypothetical protein